MSTVVVDIGSVKLALSVDGHLLAPRQLSTMPHTGNKKLSCRWQTARLEVSQGHQTVPFHMLVMVSY